MPPTQVAGGPTPAHSHCIAAWYQRHFPTRQLPAIQGKIHSRLDCQRERAPISAVHFHQRSPTVKTIEAKLHHGYTLPFEGAKQSKSLSFQLRVGLLRDRKHSCSTTTGNLF